MSADRFKPGERLVIEPADTDDPIALQRKGEAVRFMRYDHAGNCSVQLDNGRLMYFRPKDLRRPGA
jgi:hypothetical protein